MEQFQIIQPTITITKKRSELAIQSTKHALLWIGIKPAVDEPKFNLTVEKMRKAKDIDTGEDHLKTVEVLCDRYVLNKQEYANILMHFMQNKDFSLFGLTNAVTRSSQDCKDYNRATELERIGGTLLDEGVAKTEARSKILLLPQAA